MPHTKKIAYFEGGGSVVIDLNGVKAKDLLIFSSTEIPTTILGFGEPIKVSPHARFYFVGARSKSTQLPDFLSRCLSIQFDQLPKNTTNIIAWGICFSIPVWGALSIGKEPNPFGNIF